MSKRDDRNRLFRGAAFAVLALWTGWILFRFFQEHPIRFRYLLRLILEYRPPPLPTDLAKVLAAAKHLLFASALATAGVLAGHRILRALGLSRPDHEAPDRRRIVQELSLSLGLGWGLLMYLTFLLGVIGGLYAATIWGLLLLAFLVCLGDIRGLLRDLRSLARRDASEAPNAAARVCAVVVGAMLMLTMIVALAPSITHDAMVYHLNVPRQYALAHGFVEIPYDMFSNTFLNMEMLYLSALLIDDFILANLIHLILGVAVLAFLYAFCRSYLGATVAAVATMMFLFNPPVLNELPIAYVDVGMTFYFLLAIFCLWKWKTEGGTGWFVLVCVFSGIFAGMRYTAIYGLVSISLMMTAALIRSRDRRRGEVAKRLALFGGVVTLFVLPYLIKNYLMTGNPVYPVAYGVFGGRWLVPEQVARMLEYVNSHGMGHDWRHMLALPWNITIHGRVGFENFDATITPLWLIFFPALLLSRPNPPLVRWSALVCIIYFLSWAVFTHITRYMMPMFPLLSIACAYAVVDLKDKAALDSEAFAKTVKWITAAACIVVWFSFSYFFPLRVPAEFGAVVWGERGREDFLSEKVRGYDTFMYINENLPRDARLVFFWDNRGFFCDREKIGDTAIEAPMMLELVHEAGGAEAFRRKLVGMGYTHILVNRLFHMWFPVHTVSDADKLRLEGDLEIFDEFVERYCAPLFESDEVTVYELSGQKRREHESHELDE